MNWSRDHGPHFCWCVNVKKVFSSLVWCDKLRSRAVLGLKETQLPTQYDLPPQSSCSCNRENGLHLDPFALLLLSTEHIQFRKITSLTQDGFCTSRKICFCFCCLNTPRQSYFDSLTCSLLLPITLPQLPHVVSLSISLCQFYFVFSKFP